MMWSTYLVALASAHLASASNTKCSKCIGASLSIPGASIDLVEHHEQGDIITLPDVVPSCRGPNLNVTITSDLCRIVMTVPSSNSSSMRVEAWLPDDWNERFLATGNGGIGGCIDYMTMQNGAQLGFASFGTNSGHDGETGHDFFLNQPEVINDFGHRSIHVEAGVGKELVSRYYKTDDFTSYYQACSTGGRQGFQTAHLFPEDFDGILVGAPAVDWLHIVASKGILARRIGWPDLDSSAYVRPEQWTAIVEKQIELFDGLDGVEDGIIDNPTDFRFDPELLACGTGALNDSLCLTPEQVLSVERAYEPLTDSAGNIVYPSFELGSNTNVFSANQVNGSAELTYRVLDDFWRGAVYNDSTWSSHDFTQEQMDFAINLNPGGVGFHEPDLSAYASRGGKVIAYHGRVDQTITSKLATEYFSNVQASLNFTVDEMLDFYHLYLIPGHGHCRGGPGAWDIGQVYPMDQERLDEENNALLALAAWVEEGRVPKGLSGVKYEDDDVTKPILSQRKHCAYPYRSTWDKEGDPKELSSWTCEIPL